MYTDAELKFSDAQALTGPSTTVSTNVVDLSVDRDIGIGEAMAVAIFVGVAADFTTTDETYQFTVQTDSTDAFASATVVVQTAAIDGDQLPLGATVVLPIGYTNEQFLRVSYTTAGTTPLITVDAILMPMADITGTVDYASGFSIT